MKKCSHCHIDKAESDFYFVNNTNNLLRSYCKLCQSELTANWRIKNKEKWQEKKRVHDREYSRTRRATLIGYKTKEWNKYRVENPEKVKAHQIVNNAIKRGRIKRSPCEKCGLTRVHGHHFDYSQPLEVRWLCPVHHAEAHLSKERK